MNLKNAVIVTFLSSLIGAAGSGLFPAYAASQTPDAGQSAIAKRIGAIKAINGDAITLAPDSGPEIAVTVQPNARLLRIAPGEKDFKNATPIQLQDLHVGDTIRVRGRGSDDTKSIAALEIIVITRSAITAVSDQIRQDWQKRGLGGPVTAVDPCCWNGVHFDHRLRWEENSRSAHDQEHRDPSLFTRLRETRRCEGEYASGCQRWRSVARPRQSQRRRRRTGCGRDLRWRLPQFRGPD